MTKFAMHFTILQGWMEIAESLISHGAKLDQEDKVGYTPLHRAASIGNSNICELLIEKGEEADYECSNMRENEEAALLLIRYATDVDVEDEEGYTLLDRASANLRT